MYCVGWAPPTEDRPCIEVKPGRWRSPPYTNAQAGRVGTLDPKSVSERSSRQSSRAIRTLDRKSVTPRSRRKRPGRPNRQELPAALLRRALSKCQGFHRENDGLAIGSPISLRSMSTVASISPG